MPLALTLHVERMPRLRTHQRQEPAWRRLQRIADAAVPDLTLLWATLFADVRDAIPEDELRGALASGNAILVEEVLALLWYRLGETQAQRMLPVLTQEIVAQAAAAIIPSMAVSLSITIDTAFNVLVPETRAVIDQYVGTEIRSITDLTLQNVRQVIRSGFNESRSVTQMTHDVTSQIGLTPRQAKAIDALREQLQGEGLSAAQVRYRTAEASQRALRQRVEAIAKTGSMTAVNMGNYHLLVQYVKQGLLDENRVRRYWFVAQDERLCKRCAPVPGMNPDGVRLTESFATPVGTVLNPPIHVACRCTTTTEVL